VVIAAVGAARVRAQVQVRADRADFAKAARSEFSKILIFDDAGPWPALLFCERCLSGTGHYRCGLKRDEIGLRRHRALVCCLSMTFSENRCTLFRIML
jgi:hypothetical protein